MKLHESRGESISRVSRVPQFQKMIEGFSLLRGVVYLIAKGGRRRNQTCLVEGADFSLVYL